MFAPENLPAPDEYGYFFHPDVPGEEEGDDVRALCLELGYELRVVEFEYDANEELIDDYFSREDESAVTRWNPSIPEGEGWVMIAKYPTEGGPCAAFARQIQLQGTA